MFDAALIRKTKERHRRAFAWESDNVPLGIWVNDGRKRKEISYNSPDFHKLLFERQMTILEDTMALASDIVPVLGITNYGVGIVPSFFGARLRNSSSDVDKVEEMGSWVEKVFSRIEEVEGYPPPAIRSSLFDDVIEHLEYYRDTVPSDVPISTSPDGPFSIAELLRGPDFYIDLYDRPVCARRLLDICTDAIIGCEKRMRKVLGYGETIDDFPTSFGMWFPGLRIGDDSLVNLSEAMIRDFVVPCYRKIAESLHCRIEIHFCTTTRPIGEQIIKAFLDCDEVSGISTQLGTIHFERHRSLLRERLSIESGYGDAIERHIKENGTFKNWARRLKTMCGQRTGLVLYATVGSMEQGKRLLDDWREVWDSSC